MAWGGYAVSNQFLALGTLAGALDASFSTSAELEIYAVDLNDQKSTQFNKRGSLPASSR